MDLIVENFIIKNEPRMSPYILFIDDTESHFSASYVVYGLLVKPTQSNMKLSNKAQKRWAENKNNFEKYDANLGISEDGFKGLEYFVKINHKDIRTLILDWDKTTTVHGTFKSNIIDKYITECYFGGLNRMKAMKKFFKQCKQKNVYVIILTCNSRARTEEGKSAFKKALSFVGATNVEIFFTDKSKVSHINTLV